MCADCELAAIFSFIWLMWHEDIRATMDDYAVLRIDDNIDLKAKNIIEIHSFLISNLEGILIFIAFLSMVIL